MTIDEHLKRIKLSLGQSGNLHQPNLGSLAAITEHIAGVERGRDSWQAAALDAEGRILTNAEQRQVQEDAYLEALAKYEIQVFGLEEQVAALTAERDQALAQVGGYRLYLNSVDAGIATLTAERDKAIRDLGKAESKEAEARNQATTPRPGDQLATRPEDAALQAMRSHDWVGQQMGGHPADATSYEWVRHCSVCGMEDTCEDPLPPCPGDRQ